MNVSPQKVSVALGVAPGGVSSHAIINAGTSSRGLRGNSADLKSSILNLVSRLATRVCVGTPACEHWDSLLLCPPCRLHP